jgi:ATP-binding cassette subfamily C protein CydC
MADLIAYNQQQGERIASLTTTLGALQMTMARMSGLQGSLSNLFMNLTAWAMLLVAIPLVHTGHMPGVLLALLVLVALWPALRLSCHSLRHFSS